MRHKFFSLILFLLILIIAVKLVNWLLLPGKNEIVIVQESIPVNLDPSRNSSYENILPVTGIYEGLVKLNPDTLVPEPCLADRWDVSEDGKRWTFYIKPGILFSDGTACDADAVKASFLRSMSLKEVEPYCSLVFAPVSSIETGEGTVSFILKYPFSPFLKNMALPFAAPVASPTAVARHGDKFWLYPSGTGPYRLKQYSKKAVVLEPNPHYRKNTAPSKYIVIKAIPEPQERAKYLLSKKADIIFYPGSKNIDSLRAGGMKIFSAPGLDVSYLGFYTDKAPFDNKDLRLAISGLLDRENIVSGVLEGEGI
ncbi:MAG: ABC transporter substrate-binding protein, partial [Desulfocucumaceae bacterium]